MPNTDFSIETSGNLLTAGDLVGRAVSVARKNWLTLGRFFLAPTCVYWLAERCAFWEPESYSNHFSPSANYWIISLGLLFIFLSIWEISVRKFALIYYLAGAAATLEEALKKAQKKMWFILILAIPIVFFEIIENALSFFTTRLESIAAGKAATDFFAFIEMWLIGAEFVLLLPFVLVIILHAYFIAIIVFEECSIAKACARFFSFTSQDGVFISIALTLMSFVYFCVGGPIIALVSLQFLLPKDAVWYFVGGTLSSLFAAPLDGFMSAIITICGALLYKQICARQEGKDLLEKLQSLEAK